MVQEMDYIATPLLWRQQLVPSDANADAQIGSRSRILGRLSASHRKFTADLLRRSYELTQRIP